MKKEAAPLSRLEELGQEVWGNDWAERLVDAMDFKPQEVNAWLSGERPIPRELLSQLTKMNRSGSSLLCFNKQGERFVIRWERPRFKARIEPAGMLPPDNSHHKSAYYSDVLLTDILWLDPAPKLSSRARYYDQALLDAIKSLNKSP